MFVILEWIVSEKVSNKCLLIFFADTSLSSGIDHVAFPVLSEHRSESVYW